MTSKFKNAGCVRPLLAIFATATCVNAGAQFNSALLPSNGAVVDDAIIQFSWNNHPDALTYTLQIAQDPSFSNATSYPGLGGTNSVVDLSAHGNVEHYWRVRAMTAYGLTAWSSPSSITVFNPRWESSLILWVDADSGITLDGNGFVQAWADKSGTMNILSQTDANLRPLPLAEPALNGRGSVLFDGVNDHLNFSLAYSNIRTAFWLVKEDPDATVNTRCLLGDNGSAYDFHRGFGDKYVWSTLWTPSYVLNGLLRINGMQKNGGTTPMPTKHALISVRTLANSRAGNFSRDRTFNDRVWDGSLTELMLFNTALPETTMKVVENLIQQKTFPLVSLGPDTILPYGFCTNMTLSAPNYYTSYQWSTGSTTSTATITQPGSYSVTVTDLFDQQSVDTIVVHPPDPFARKTHFVCLDDTLVLDAYIGSDYTYSWPGYSSNSLIAITQPGTYAYEILDTAGCLLQRSVEVLVDSFPTTTTLGPDKSICAGESLDLDNGAEEAVSYLWSTGSTTDTIVVLTGGTYSVTVTNINGCVASDTINLTILGGSLPIPDFSVEKNCLADSVEFTDLSDPGGATIVSWEWTFGDAGTSALQHPQHKYGSTGTYPVRLEILTDAGCKNNITRQVQIHPSPVADFSVTGFCLGSPTVFTDQSTISSGAIWAWDWDFGDGNISQLQHPTHTYLSSGLLGVSLIVTSDSGCKAIASELPFIHIPPVADFAFDTVCFGSATSFTDLSVPGPTGAITGRIWTFGDGDGAFNDTAPKHAYSEDGAYLVRLEVFAAATGCGHDTTKSVTVYKQPKASFSADIVCVGESAQFTDLSQGFGTQVVTWQWNFGDGSSSLDQHPLHTYASAGTYAVELVVTNNIGCSNDLDTIVTATDLPSTKFVFQPAFGAAPAEITFTNQTGNATSFEWYLEGNLIGTGQNATQVFATDGVYRVTLVATNDAGCTRSYTDSIFIALPRLDVAVESVNAIQQLQPDGSILVSVEALVINVGSIKVNSLDMLASLQFDNPVSEHWTESLFAGQAKTYRFSSGFRLKELDKEFVCVEAVSPNGSEDDHPGNNKLCKELKSTFLALAPFPNPASSALEFMVLMPQDGRIDLLQYNVIGQRLEGLVIEGTKGVNRISLDVTGNPNGLYIYRIMAGDSEAIFPVMVSK